MSNLISQYKIFLRNNSNKLRAIKEKAYLYSDLDHYGVSMWQRDKFLQSHKKQLKQLPKKDILALVKLLWKQSSFEEKHLALEILQLISDDIDIDDMILIEKLMRQSGGWALLDSLIVPIMPSVLAKNQKGYDYLKKWILDDDYWVKRSALLAQLLFFRRDNGGDRKLFFFMAKSQFNEKWIDEKYKNKLTNKRAKFFIRKAIGWVLREMSVKQPQIVYQFLIENKSQMSGLSFREASRKLPNELYARLMNQR